MAVSLEGNGIHLTNNTQTNIKMQDHVIDFLKNSFSEGFCHDMILKVGTDCQSEIPCHRLVLAFASEFLRDLLNTSEPGKIPVLVLPDIEHDTMESILEYLYTGQLRLPSDKLVEFVDACNLLKLKGMLNYNMPGDANQLLDEPTDTTYEEYVDDDLDTLGVHDEIEYCDESDETMIAKYDTEVVEMEAPVQLPPEIKLKRIPSPIYTKTVTLPQIPPKFKEVNSSATFNIKNARLQADGTANINEANIPYLRERLEACIAKIFENVHSAPGVAARGSLYQVKMLFCSNPPKLKGIFECLMCGSKTINVCYKHKNGKFKQWINSNILRHVELSHKERSKLKIVRKEITPPEKTDKL